MSISDFWQKRASASTDTNVTPAVGPVAGGSTYTLQTGISSQLNTSIWNTSAISISTDVDIKEELIKKLEEKLAQAAKVLHIYAEEGNWSTSFDASKDRFAGAKGEGYELAKEFFDDAKEEYKKAFEK